METLLSNLGWIILVVFVLTLFLYKKITKDKDGLTSKFIAKQVLQLKLDEALLISKQALENAKFSKVSLNLNANKVDAQNGFSMSSFSEYIQVEANEIAGATEIKFKSICAVPTQIYDWGKNRRNYRRFEKELKKLTSSTAVSYNLSQI